MTRRSLRLARLALRLALLLPVLVAASQQWGEAYGQFWLPWYGTVLRLVLPDYQVTALNVVERDHETRIAAQFSATEYQEVGGRLLPPGFTVNASTLLDHALIHPLILLAAVLAWPGVSGRQRLLWLLSSLLLLGILESLDVPLSLAGAVSDVVTWQASQGSASPSVLTGWSVMLDGGGRLALSLATAVIGGVMSGWLGPRLSAATSVTRRRASETDNG